METFKKINCPECNACELVALGEYEHYTETLNGNHVHSTTIASSEGNLCELVCRNCSMRFYPCKYCSTHDNTPLCDLDFSTHVDFFSSQDDSQDDKSCESCDESRIDYDSDKYKFVFCKILSFVYTKRIDNTVWGALPKVTWKDTYDLDENGMIKFYNYNGKNDYCSYVDLRSLDIDRIPSVPYIPITGEEGGNAVITRCPQCNKYILQEDK